MIGDGPNVSHQFVEYDEVKNRHYHFSQYEKKTLYEELDQFNDLLRRCHIRSCLLDLAQNFYYRLLTSNRTIIDVASCATLLKKTVEEGYELLEEMASSSYQP